MLVTPVYLDEYLETPIDEVHAAVVERVNQFPYGSVELLRSETLPGAVSYSLRDRMLGDIALITLRRKSEILTQVLITDPLYGRLAAPSASLTSEREEPRRSRKELQRRLVEWILVRLRPDSVWRPLVLRRLALGRAENEEMEDGPWNAIPSGWRRRAVRDWWRGDNVPAIASRVHRSSKTVRNRLSELRKEHGSEIVPLKEDLRNMGRLG